VRHTSRKTCGHEESVNGDVVLECTLQQNNRYITSSGLETEWASERKR